MGYPVPNVERGVKMAEKFQGSGEFGGASTEKFDPDPVSQIGPGFGEPAPIPLEDPVPVSTGGIADGTIRNSALCSGSIQERHVRGGGLTGDVVILDGTISLGLFAEGIAPVQVVTSLPACSLGEEGDVAFLTTDNQLYRCDGSAWQVLTPDGANIIANTITAGQIAAGAIGTDELAANSVTSVKVAANQIFARNIVVGSFDNLITNPTFENDTIDGADDPHFYSASGGEWQSGTGAPRAGTRSARFDRDSQTTTAYVQFNGPTASAADMANHVACSEGDEFYFEFYARENGLNPTPDVDAWAGFFDEDGAQVGAAINGPDVSPTTTYQKSSVTVTAPAGAAYVVFRARVLYDAGDVAGAITLIDSAYARRVVDDPLIGSISADKITAGTISSQISLDSGGWLRIGDTGANDFNVFVDPSTAWGESSVEDMIQFRKGTSQGFIIGWRPGANIVVTSAIIDFELNEVAAGSGILGYRFFTGGTERIRIQDTNSATGPLIALSGDTNTGIYRPGADRVGLTAGGQLMVDVDAPNDRVRFLADGTNAHSYMEQSGDTRWYRLGGESNDGLGYDPVAEEAYFDIGNNTKMILTGTVVRFQEAYDATTASAANVFVASNGQLQRSTSTERMKTFRGWIPAGNGVLDLSPIHFQGHQLVRELNKDGDQRTVSAQLEPLAREQWGLTAEDVASNLPMASIPSVDGDPEAIDWNAVTAALLAEVKALNDRVAQLEST